MTREFMHDPIFRSANPIEYRLAQFDPVSAQKIRGDLRTRNAAIAGLSRRVRTMRKKGRKDEEFLTAVTTLSELRRKEFQVRRLLVGVYTPEDD